MSLNKKQSSTYIKYACGCFLYAPSIYLASLQKGFWYTAQKLILNVSEAARMPLVSFYGTYRTSTKILFLRLSSFESGTSI